MRKPRRASTNSCLIACRGSSCVTSRKRTTRPRLPPRRCSRSSIAGVPVRSSWWPSSIDPDRGWRSANEATRATEAGCNRGVELTRNGNGYVVRVLVYPRAEVLDPQGRAIEDALGRIGFDGVERIRAGKTFEVSLNAASRAEASEAIERMCRQLLANPIVEDYSVEWLSR
ncbi:MAG: phosphoribosylformylglycinamidine synthase subunit PurS [Acidobacteria bacterium]|nr:phosphoribosylformylglycinamidine synthase subunit PurS [Acidobacteriota bacterium]